MVDLYVDMSGEDESDNKCRHARRRRIEIRRNVNFGGEASPSVLSPHRAGKRLYTSEMDVSGVEKRSPSANTSSHSRTPTGFSIVESSLLSASSSVDDVESAVVGSSSGRKLALNTPIAFGSVSLTGRAREMEDAVSVRPGFFQFLDGSFPLHFFGVFDGHGGSHVSALCKDMMHSLLSEELMKPPALDKPFDTEETRWRSAVERCFVRMDQLALSACACGRVGEPFCRCDRSGIESEIVGSTAVIAVIGGNRLLVANCGDSRAVLSRGGRTVPLSIDHKPDRPDELARIEAAGGRVIYVNGARVQGILAMSRALELDGSLCFLLRFKVDVMKDKIFTGDKYLKPVVISTPEIVILEITPEDECLIIASDGLWDVIPNELACNVARRCLAEGGRKVTERDLNSQTSAGAGPSNIGKDPVAPEAWCSLAAALLARLALGRRSTDNISVIVVDLRRG